jgi:3-oxoacyl-[acyl-carrier protein] reductase
MAANGWCHERIVAASAGRTAIVTGAGGGIGRGLALALAAAGANVVIAARRAETGDETRALIEAEGGRAVCVAGDVAQQAQVQRAVRAALEHFGGLDIVVHNASSGQSSVPTACEAIDDARRFRFMSRWMPFHRAGRIRARCQRARALVISVPHTALHGAMNPVYAAVKNAQRGMGYGWRANGGRTASR